MARVLLLMSTRTYRARAFLTAASRLDLEVTVGTEQEHVLSTPGSTVALDLRRPRRAVEQILELAERYPLDAVVGVDDDTILLAAMAAEALKLPHNSVESVKATRYKDVMRLILSETDLNSPDFLLAQLDDAPEELANNVSYPCVLKPLSLSASRGVIRADTPAQFVAAFRDVVDILSEADLDPNDPGTHQLLVESFIPGHEVAVEGILSDGQLTVLALFDKPDPLDGPYFEETIYLTPSRLPQLDQRAISDAAAKAAKAVGLREGPIHAEVRLNERGPWVVEVAARSIGGQCSDSLRFDFDLSLEEIILRQATSMHIQSVDREHAAAGVMMIPIPRGGTLHGVRGRTDAKAVPGVEEVTVSIPIGGQVVPLPRGTKYLGFIVARGETVDEVESALREAHHRLDFDIRDSETRGS